MISAPWMIIMDEISIIIDISLMIIFYNSLCDLFFGIRLRIRGISLQIPVLLQLY